MQTSKSGTIVILLLLKCLCKASSCYRALFPCPIPSAVSVASAFCATITSGGVTATNYPARATAACGTTASRYLSACSCGPTCTPTTTTAPCTATPTAGLVYGDFECGIGSWTSTVYDPAATISVTSPGFTGNKAVKVDFTAPEISPQLGVNAPLYSPTFSIIPGNSYKLTFATWFDIAVGFIGVNVNNNGQSETDIFAIDSSASQWTFNQVEWDAGSEDVTAVIVFEFVFGNTTNVEKIDDVIFASLSDCGADVGILPNGEFECGISPWIIEIPDLVAIALVTSTNPHIGKNSFEVDFTAPPISPDLGDSARIISQALPVTPGTSYLLQFYTIF
jgi:hypothetical protein